ncbi:MAG: alpha-D-glucose phosphate-specific phosphoglucomutase [Bryobacterales bacterium]|nr:alpha-D-glucose phosphate-specific phosphoglucomutase [Bryobacterales bacterium]
MSNARLIPTHPIAGQKPGTSGLRKKTREFMRPGYLENFVQAIFNVLHEDHPGGLGGQTLIVGGDGRYFNREAVLTILRIAAGNGLGRMLVAQRGILSTPAMSIEIRARGAAGGILLSASHNPGGPDADFGIKFNTSNGGPAPESFTARIHAHTLRLTEYRWVEQSGLPIDDLGDFTLGAMNVSVIDSLDGYVAAMQSIFDFDRLRAHLASGFRICFDAMNGVTGPYARRIFEDLLGAAPGTVIRSEPLEDFGGDHPDPNLSHAAALVARLSAPDAPDFGAACDGDGDRNLILGKSFFVSPGDSLAVIAEHAAQAIPAYRAGLAGVARSMPTSMAADRVAAQLGIPSFETPTGWKFFSSLLDAGRITLCGEESFGTGSSHAREKDGIWAVLAWLSILADTRQPVSEIVNAHWRRFGRSYYQRHDYEALDATAADAMLARLRARLDSLGGLSFAGSTIESAGEFNYTDPVNGDTSNNQGVRIFLADGSRAVIRLSGTGTEGATLRLYYESYSKDDIGQDCAARIEPLAAAIRALLELEQSVGRVQPDVIT